MILLGISLNKFQQNNQIDKWEYDKKFYINNLKCINAN